MRQLTALDAQFLNIETATTAAHVAGLALLDSADGSVTRDALAELLLDRLHLSPALSLRVAEVPLGLDLPYWAADPDFDIDNHLFEMALPEPGDDWQLAEAVAEIHARRLDRAHPLWEMHLINGLIGGKVAVYTKVHHAAIDGISGAETLATLLDLTPDGHLTRRRSPDPETRSPDPETRSTDAIVAEARTTKSGTRPATGTGPAPKALSTSTIATAATPTAVISGSAISIPASTAAVGASAATAMPTPATTAFAAIGTTSIPAAAATSTVSIPVSAAAVASAAAIPIPSRTSAVGDSAAERACEGALVDEHGVAPRQRVSSVKGGHAANGTARRKRTASPDGVSSSAASPDTAGAASPDAASPSDPSRDGGARDRAVSPAGVAPRDGACPGVDTASCDVAAPRDSGSSHSEVQHVDQPYDDAPGLVGMLAGAAVRTVTHPVRAVQSVVRAAGDLDAIPVVGGLPGAKLIAKAARVVARDQQRRPDLPSLTVPRTPLNGPISARRHLSFGSLSLKDIKKVAKANGISVNDVVMALCTSALRSWLRERDALPEEPLIVAVPVAVRKAKAKDLVGNQISAMVAPMPTNVPDPKERLQAVGAVMGRAKRRFALAPATWLSELCSVLPAPVTSLATPALFRLAGLAFPPINLIISNVPGPQFPLYLCGGRVLSYYPMSVLTDMSGGLNITCFSYDGMLDFGIVACPERMDDVWGLLDHLRTALDELLDERVGDEFRDGVRVDLVAG